MSAISLMFPRRPVLGLEITSTAVRMVALSSAIRPGILSVKKVDLPENMVSESYGSPNVRDPEGLNRVLRDCVDGLSAKNARRAGLSLSDGIFRVQTLEFDQLPRNGRDRERLIRWRLEKTAAFDISDSVLRHQVLRQSKGFTILVCVAKQLVLSQYETLLKGLGLEPWSVGLSSFHTLNFYSPYITKKSKLAALTHVTEDSLTTIIAENGSVRFYRYKEIKRGNSIDIRPRLIREIEDSLHFYTHLDRGQQAEAPRLYISGESSLRDGLAEELGAVSTLSAEVLVPALVLPSAAEAGPEMAAAFGAGGAL